MSETDTNLGNTPMEPQQYNDAYFEGVHRRNVETFKAVLVDNPLDADAHYRIGHEYNILGEYTAAVNHLQSAIRLAPDHFHGYNRDAFVSNVHSNWAYVLSTTGNLVEALLHQREACRLTPNDGDRNAGEASILRELGQTDAAIEAYKVALGKEVLREPSLVLDLLGKLYMEKKMLREAADSFAQAVKIHPDFPMGWLHLGIAQYQLGEWNKASANFQQVLQFPNFVSECAEARDYLDRIAGSS